MPVPAMTSRGITRPPITRQPRSAITSAQLLDAALAEFAAHGFEAASTRAIAQRAGVHQPQINYHFASKDELWRAAVDHLFAQLDAVMAAPREPAPGAGTSSARTLLETIIRRFVGFAAQHPELNRIMVHEATADSERLDWLVERHVRTRFLQIAELLGAAGLPAVAGHDPVILYYSLIGAASLMYVNAPEARRLTGHDPSRPEIITAHADLLVALLLGPPTVSRTDTNREHP